MERDTTHEQEPEDLIVYGEIVKVMVPQTHYRWQCPQCGEWLHVAHPEGVEQMSKGGPLPVEAGKCSAPNCNGSATDYKTQRALTAVHTKGPNRQQRRTLAKTKNTGVLRGPVNGS